MSDVLSQYKRILNFASRYGSAVREIFLECPEHSIKIWNKGQCHPDSESFFVNTEILISRLDVLNRDLQRLNDASNITAPKFGINLLKAEKATRVTYVQKSHIYTFERLHTY